MGTSAYLWLDYAMISSMSSLGDTSFLDGVAGPGLLVEEIVDGFHSGTTASTSGRPARREAPAAMEVERTQDVQSDHASVQHSFRRHVPLHGWPAAGASVRGSADGENAGRVLPPD